MRDLSEAKTIIGWEIKQDLQAGTLQINQKGYIWNLLEAKKMSLCHPTVLPMKVGSMISFNQAGDHN